MHYLQCQGIAMRHISNFADETKDCVSMQGGWNMFRTFQTINQMCEVVVIYVPECSAKCETCHMALPLKIMHFRLCVGLCVKFCGAFREINLNHFSHFI